MQYIAYRKLTLEKNGELDLEALSKLGLGKPGDKFWVHCIMSFVKKISIQLDHG